jgi:hypothetical protein
LRTITKKPNSRLRLNGATKGSCRWQLFLFLWETK